MERVCGHCGKPFEAQRPTAKYCGSSCRGKASTARKREAALAPVVAIKKASKTSTRRKPVPAAKGGGSPVDEAPAGGETEPAGLIGVVTRQLTEARKLDTYVGQQALLVARRMTEATFDTGSAFAALSKELDRLMAAALANVKPEPDLLDNLVGEVVEMRSRRRG